MKVLISAYACEPGKGSEPGVGWNWAVQAARRHEVWVLTRTSNRPSIEAALEHDPVPRLHFLYEDFPEWARFWKRGQRGVHAYYLAWQLAAYRRARGSHKQIHFHLVHHLTFSAYWMAPLVGLLEAPFLWGPIGGAERLPAGLSDLLTMKHKIREFCKQTVGDLSRMDPVLRKTMRRASLILAQTPSTIDRLPARFRDKAIVFPAVGVEVPCGDNRRDSGADAPIRVISCGNLEYFKGHALGLRAFAGFAREHPNSEYRIAGEGRELVHLEKLADELGITNNVRFVGPLSRADLLRQIEACDILLHPSLRDPATWVVLEAMACSRPVICLDVGGPAIQVTRETGIPVPAGPNDRVVADLGRALSVLAADQPLRDRMGAAGRRRVESEYVWPRRGDAILELYEKAARGSGEH